MRIRTLDLFCGGGGSSYGARRAGAQIVCGIDAWGVAVETYQANFPEAQALLLELSDTTMVAGISGLEEIDLLLASPECTNHTLARGSRPIDEASRGTATYVVGFARVLQPRWIVVENVIQMRSWDGYPNLLNSLENLGYHLRVEVLNASQFGVRQSRRRLFIIGDRQAPPPRIARRKGKSPAAAGILDPVGTWRSRPLYTPKRAAATIERAERAMTELGMYEDFLIVYYGSDGAGGWQPLDRPLRTITTLDRFALVTWEGREAQIRMLQPTELARAMGFELDFSLAAAPSRRDRIKVLGNGVAPPVMEAIVRSLTSNS
ncbi:MAG: (cytosine-5-)-methyltransferase [Spirosoma sp.]|nr:(cytosine-5-)-methyltransferase [Spirosoma sp.]